MQRKGEVAECWDEKAQVCCKGVVGGGGDVQRVWNDLANAGRGSEGENKGNIHGIEGVNEG